MQKLLMQAVAAVMRHSRMTPHLNESCISFSAFRFAGAWVRTATQHEKIVGVVKQCKFYRAVHGLCTHFLPLFGEENGLSLLAFLVCTLETLAVST